jgi:hypothetical protein
MSDDDRRSAGILEHLCPDVAGEGARDFAVAVLTCDADATGGDLRRTRGQRRGHADQNLSTKRRRRHRACDRLNLAQLWR